MHIICDMERICELHYEHEGEMAAHLTMGSITRDFNRVLHTLISVHLRKTVVRQAQLDWACT